MSVCVFISSMIYHSESTHTDLNWSLQLAVSLPRAGCQPLVGPLEFVFICLRCGFITQSALHNHLRAAVGGKKDTHSEEGGEKTGLGYLVTLGTSRISVGPHMRLPGHIL